MPLSYAARHVRIPPRDLARPAGRVPGEPLEPAAWPAERAYADLPNKRVFQNEGTSGNVNDDFLFALVDPPWKYIHHLENPQESELYHLGNDTDEAANLLAARPDLAVRYSGYLRRLEPLPTGPVPEVQLGEDELERLRVLGYVED